MPTDITTSTVFAFLLVFFRLGSGVMLIPGIGEGYVPIRIRLLLALTFSLVVYLTVRNDLPTIPGTVPGLLILIAGEILIGAFIGMLTRILINTLHTAGMIMAYQSGLGSAMIFDPNSGSQGSVEGNFITLIAITLFFVTDLHHLVIMGLADSYHMFPPGAFPPLEDMTALITKVIAGTFDVAIKIAAPHLIIGLIVYLSGGIMSRLMPSMQIFFVMMPLQLLVSFFILTVTFSAAVMWYMEYFQETMAGFLTSG